MTSRKAAMTLLCGLSWWGLVASVQAQTCQQDSDCEKGFYCDAESFGRSSCQPGPCETDADCGDGSTCYERTWRTCTGGAVPCVPGGVCRDSPLVCENHSERLCMPGYLQPCAADSCGDGFICEEKTSSTCEGTPSTPPSYGSTGPVRPGGPPTAVAGSSAPTPTTPPSIGSAGAVAPVAPPITVAGSSAPTPTPPPANGSSCALTPSGVSACHLAPFDCAEDSDCGAGYSCENVIFGTPGTGLTAAAPAACGPNDPDVCAPTPPPARLRCLPAYAQSSLGGKLVWNKDRKDPLIVSEDGSKPYSMSPDLPTNGVFSLPVAGAGSSTPPVEPPAPTRAPVPTPTPVASPTPASGQPAAGPTSASLQPLSAAELPKEAAQTSSESTSGCTVAAGAGPSGYAFLAAVLGMNLWRGRRRRN